MNTKYYFYKYEDNFFTKEEEKMCLYNWKERINYYMKYSYYFLKLLWESIITFSWKI